MDELLTVSQTAKILKVNPTTVYKLIKQGYIRCLKLGGKKIRRKTLEDFMENYEGYEIDLDGTPKKLEE